jgi:hypothetical protein
LNCLFISVRNGLERKGLDEEENELGAVMRPLRHWRKEKLKTNLQPNSSHHSKCELI